MLLDFLNPEIISEIISPKDYKKTRKKLNKIDIKEYKKVLPILKKIFTDLNKGKFARTVVFDYNSIKIEKSALNEYDRELMGVLQSLDYEVSDESYELGVCKKNDKIITIHSVITPLRKKTSTAIDSMQTTYEKTKNESIRKQLVAIRAINQRIVYERTIPYRLSLNEGFKLVFSIESRKVASQSTKVGWTSCMNLYDGAYKKYVMSGIQEGVIVVYLVKTGDEKALESPTARLLLKPLKSIEDPNEIIWVVDTVYGSAPNNVEFKKKVEQVFNKYSSTKESIFILNDKNIYPDNISTSKNKISEKEINRLDDEYRKVYRNPIELTKFLAGLNKSSLYYIVKNYSTFNYISYEHPDIDILIDKLIDLGYTFYYDISFRYLKKIKNLDTITKIIDVMLEQTGAATIVDLILDTFGKDFKLIGHLYTKSKNNELKNELIKVLPKTFAKLYSKKSNRISFNEDMSESEFLKYFETEVLQNKSNANANANLVNSVKKLNLRNTKERDQIMSKVYDILKKHIGEKEINYVFEEVSRDLITKNVVLKMLNDYTKEQLSRMQFRSSAILQIGMANIIKYKEKIIDAMGSNSELLSIIIDNDERGVFIKSILESPKSTIAEFLFKGIFEKSIRKLLKEKIISEDDYFKLISVATEVKTDPESLIGYYIGKTIGIYLTSELISLKTLRKLSKLKADRSSIEGSINIGRQKLNPNKVRRINNMFKLKISLRETITRKEYNIPESYIDKALSLNKW